jgi:RNA polymerase sigma-32 factor
MSSISYDPSLTSYMKKSKDAIFLTLEQELFYAQEYQKDPNGSSGKKAMEILATAHLRLCIRLAAKYKGYGFSIGDLIAEGNVGLVHAIRKFDSSKGFRLSTYATFWIKASITSYIISNWSLVKIGTTSAQKTLFFSLRRLKNELKCLEDGDLSAEHLKEIADIARVTLREVQEVNRRIGGDLSLQAPIGTEDSAMGQWQDFLVASEESPETLLCEADELAYQRVLLSKAMSVLTPLEKSIFTARHLQLESETLDSLAKKHGVSRERIRQRNAKCLEKINKEVLRLLSEKNEISSAVDTKTSVKRAARH